MKNDPPGKILAAASSEEASALWVITGRVFCFILALSPSCRTAELFRYIEFRQ